MRAFALVTLMCVGVSSFGQNFKLAVLKYNGGGDWYANLATSLPNLIQYANQQLKSDIDSEQDVVEVGSKDLFKYPFVHMTGHGNVIFSDQEIQNLRKYLLSGGFLHIDDNYGMDQFVRTELKKLFPEYELTELPFSHPIYHQKFDFNNGLPKVHEHNKNRPQGLGIIHNGRLVLFYTYECDLGDGWESSTVHNDSEETRTKALQMGTNILQYVLMGNDPDQFGSDIR
ncbi:MAG: DUF4159 domain-containing protein [Flavobacteriales bacterium]|nr:DUF4159 domain-containing protein [Flavobacteriales bacterium]MCB9192702.1 DUF4159 domain-containing protein [Flavobacteriales bacterium]MCB9205199.1 DUF4159 domain-containing protein [Flavobacteriales bacterium]